VDYDGYVEHLKMKDENFESLCKRCGACCGAEDDPCTNLRKSGEGRYYCKDYFNRLGPQRTVSGRRFECVSIREHIKNKTLRPGCAYWG